jgi:nitrogen fixation protein FixH
MNRGHLWIGFVIGLLAANVLAVSILIGESGNAPPRVMPDYYRRAVAYEDVLVEERASQRLGWVATPTLRDGVLELRLADRDAAPIRGAAVTVTVDPRGRTDRTATATLTEAEAGVYRGAVRGGPPGLYVVATVAVRAGDRFVHTATIEGAP